MPVNPIYDSDSKHFSTSDRFKGQEVFKSQPISEIGLTGRYSKVIPGINNEEFYAQRQSGWDQLGNGIAKMAGTFTTSFVGGTIGLMEGIGRVASGGKFSELYDNESNRYFDRMNQELENALPNYYTQAEQDAEWYSPTNIFSANFLGDKVLKNLGYSFGALAGGMGWGAALRGVAKIARLVNAGKALQAIEATEKAIMNAPKLQRLGAVNSALNSTWSGVKATAGKLIPGQRGIVSLFGTFGEASIEGMHNANNFRDKAIGEFERMYGAPPTGEDLEEINNYADKVGNYTFGANTALLTLTNYIQLPKILASSKSLEKRAINSIEREATQTAVEGAEKKALTGLEETTAKWTKDKTAYRGNVLSPVINKLGKPGRFVDKYLLGPGRLTFSASEAFEEGAQFSIESGVNDYFNRAYEYGQDAENLLGEVGKVLGNVFSEGVDKTLNSKEGMESILIGGISGALQKARGQIKERGFFGTGGERGKNTQVAIDSLNKTNIQVLQLDHNNLDKMLLQTMIH
jgi:hypothetical protein